MPAFSIKTTEIEPLSTGEIFLQREHPWDAMWPRNSQIYIVAEMSDETQVKPTLTDHLKKLPQTVKRCLQAHSAWLQNSLNLHRVVQAQAQNLEMVSSTYAMKLLNATFFDVFSMSPFLWNYCWANILLTKLVIVTVFSTTNTFLSPVAMVISSYRSYTLLLRSSTTFDLVYHAW